MAQAGGVGHGVCPAGGGSFAEFGMWEEGEPNQHHAVMRCSRKQHDFVRHLWGNMPCCSVLAGPRGSRFQHWRGKRAYWIARGSASISS